MNITTLKAATTLSDWQSLKMNPEVAEDYIRQDLAQQLVDAILDEDLILIHTNKNLSTNTLTVQAQLKIIQE